MRFLLILASILGPNMGSPKVGPLDIFSIFFQDASKTPQDVPKSAPRAPQEAPRVPQEQPKVTQECPKTRQERLKSLPRGPNHAPKERKSRKSYRKGTITGNNAENQTKNTFLIKRFIVRGEFSNADPSFCMRWTLPTQKSLSHFPQTTFFD